MTDQYGTWIKCSDRLPEPETKVIAKYVNSHEKSRRIMAMYIPQFTIESSSDTEDDFDDYHEATDTYYIKQGWYESVENWEEISLINIDEFVVTNWCYLPEDPKD